MKLQVANNIDLDINILQRQLDIGEERSINADSSADTQKAGDGRDLGYKEHEAKQEEPKQKTDGKQIEQNGSTGELLKNLKYDISLNDKPKIRLDEIINGYYLWEILQIEDKLAGKLPEGTTTTEFRTGFLSVVDIDTFEKTIGDDENKKREIEEKRAKGIGDIFVIETLDGDIIELDESILKSKEMGTTLEKQRAANSSIRYANGRETEKPDTNMQVSRTSLYEIPMAHERFNVDENWYLGVDNDMDWVQKGEMPDAGNKKEISFVQVSRDESYYNREERIQNTVEYKLKPINEPELTLGYEKEEREQREQLRKKDADEAQNIRREHTEELLEECLEKFKNWDEYYNKNDIKNKVEAYHNQGLNDEEVIAQVGEDINNAERFEHDSPNLYGQHN